MALHPSLSTSADPLVDLVSSDPEAVELLKALHILTRDGKINQDSRRKFKQVQHLCQFIIPILSEIYESQQSAIIVDHGAGKSYLGFMLYHFYLRMHAPLATMIGVETRPELVQRSKELAEKLHFNRMQFAALTVEEAIKAPTIPATVDMVTALHACDTATDDAIQFGILKQAQAIICVPCCQAEVAKLFRQQKAQSLKSVLTEIWRHPIHTREFGSHLTNVLRCLQLQAAGYQVTVTELIGWEHSMKNELIVAQKSSGVAQKNARDRLEEILKMFHLESLGSRFGIYQ